MPCQTPARTAKLERSLRMKSAPRSRNTGRPVRITSAIRTVRIRSAVTSVASNAPWKAIPRQSVRRPRRARSTATVVDEVGATAAISTGSGTVGRTAR